MTQIYADLHLHSYYSDGHTAPEELLLRAAYAGLSTISLTDHDTVDGLLPILKQTGNGAPAVVPGVELSCTVGNDEIHLLGYWIDPGNVRLKEELKRIRDGRVERAKRMVDRLRDFQITLDLDKVMSLTRNGLVGRPHIAKAMVLAGAVPNESTAFRKYLRDGRPAAFPKKFLKPEEGIRILRQAGAVVSVAHPGISITEKRLGELKEYGLNCLEVWHPRHTHREIEKFVHLAESLDLVPTGGSDYHGHQSSATILGHYGLTRSRYESFASLR